MPFNQRMGRISFWDLTIGKKEFQQLMYFFDEVFEVYTKSNVINCTCYREVQQSADPQCPLCNGTGSILGWTEEPVGSFLGRLDVTTERQQDNHQRLYTKGGMVDTFDGAVYADGKWYYKIKVDDVLVFRKKDTAEGIELKVIAVVPRRGQHSEIIFVRLDVERQVNPQVLTATNISGTI